MRVTPKSRLLIRIQNILFLALLLGVFGMLAWLSQHYKYESDWTDYSRHTLSEATIELLSRIDDPISITVFIDTTNLGPAKQQLTQIIDRYKKHKNDIYLDFVNTETEPDKVRDQNIQYNGEAVFSYKDGTVREHINNFTESTLSNIFLQLIQRENNRVIFLTGHGERNPNNKTNHDYSNFAHHLQEKGFRIGVLNLLESPEIPPDTSGLVIASPQTEYLPGEVDILLKYIQNGGNLLWLQEPGELYGLQPLLQQLGIRFVKGTIVDPTPQELGLNAPPTFAIVSDYSVSDHPIISSLQSRTLFPISAGIEASNNSKFQISPLLQTVPRSWSETSKLDGIINYDSGQDTAGPLQIGVGLTRTTEAHDIKQRIVVLGDADFISNTYLDNGGNKRLGFNIIDWVNHDDISLDISSYKGPDAELILDSITLALLGLILQFGLPGILLSYGLYIWWQRRKP